jgi:hypothetical protein
LQKDRQVGGDGWRRLKWRLRRKVDSERVRTRFCASRGCMTGDDARHPGPSCYGGRHERGTSFQGGFGR